MCWLQVQLTRGARGGGASLLDSWVVGGLQSTKGEEFRGVGAALRLRSATVPP